MNRRIVRTARRGLITEMSAGDSTATSRLSGRRASRSRSCTKRRSARISAAGKVTVASPPTCSRPEPSLVARRCSALATACRSVGESNMVRSGSRSAGPLSACSGTTGCAGVPVSVRPIFPASVSTTPAMTMALAADNPISSRLSARTPRTSGLIRGGAGAMTRIGYNPPRTSSTRSTRSSCALHVSRFSAALPNATIGSKRSTHCW